MAEFDVNIEGLAPRDPNLNDYIIKGEVGGVSYRTTVQKMANLLNISGDISFKGDLLAADSSTAADGWYIAKESADYTAKGTTITVSLTNTFVVLIITSNPDLFSKVDVPLDISLDSVSTFTDDIPTFESENLVRSGGVYNSLGDKADLTVGKNLFDKTDITENTFASSNGIENSSTAYDFTGFIKVDENTQYIANQTYRFSTYYDINKNLVAGGSDNFVSEPITIPLGVSYVRLTIFSDNEDLFQFEKGTVSTSYEEYRLSVPENQLNISLESVNVITDDTPTFESENLVKSGGVVDYVELKRQEAIGEANNYTDSSLSSIVIDSIPTLNSTNSVQSGGVYNSLELKKQEAIDESNNYTDSSLSSIVIDSTPTPNSTNSVQSGGVADSLEYKADLTVGKNLFDKNDITEDTLTSSNGIEISSTTYDLTGFMKVDEGDEYIANLGVRFSTYYDINKNVVAGGSNNFFVDPITIPLGVSYVRLTIFSGNENEFQFEKGTVSTSYEKYRLSVPENQLNISLESVNVITDDTPTFESENLVKSGGVVDYVELKKQEAINEANNYTDSSINNIVIDPTPTLNSNNSVQSGGVVDYVELKRQEAIGEANNYTDSSISSIVIDSTPTPNSTNSVQSGGVADSLGDKADLTVGKNLFDKNDITENTFAGSNGVEISSTTYDLTGFMRVDENTQYIANQTYRFSTYYDINKNLVAGGSDNFVSDPITIPLGVSYVRLTIFSDNENEFQFEKGSVSTSYEEYRVSVPENQLKSIEQKYRLNTIDNKIELDELGFVASTKNLFNKENSIDETFVNWVTGNLSANTSYFTSDFIPVEDGDYVLSGTSNRSYAVYDENYEFIRGGQFTDLYNFNSSEKFIRISGDLGDEDLTQFEKGSNPTIYKPFGFVLEGVFVEQDNTSSKWDGVESNCLGDSLTAQNKWQPILVSNLGLINTSYGIGGTKFSGTGSDSFNNDARINQLSITAKLIITMGGTNDWAQNVSLGNEDSVDVNTFYGALNVYISKLVTKYYQNELTQFVFIGTPYGELYDYEPRGWDNAYTNTQGLTTKDYAKAVKNRCNFYGLPYIDPVFGWNSINIRDYMVDDGGLLHPNESGGERIASIVAGFLKNIEPLQ